MSSAPSVAAVTISYPPELPITGRRADLAAAIRDNQVVIVAGETGSGKTTQLPKICLELGRGRDGMIGHTQPRRLAARTVAARIAEELDTPIGDLVGWKVRFTDEVSDGTRIKLMTDGILLAELGRDRMLRRYDTLIIDEAHERSLNIDFILGYLKRLLPKRPDLKLIITSATIDPERFSRHFDNAPVIEVSGRTYPVEVRYRPLTDPEDGPGGEETDELDQPEAIVRACRELAAEGPGDVLVFLAGERDIRDTAEVLAGEITEDNTAGGILRNTEILPLYARLSAAELQRVWARPGRGVARRIVLATNVAETSLTVPGIKYVVDTGLARISRYSHRTKVQRLPIEKISQASADQRAGRCGRTSDGICVRLYSSDDLDARPEFTDPEILRTNLASVVLRMIALGLGEVAAFPFVDPPDRRAVADGVNLLHELGAIGPENKITDIGRSLERLPVDPRFARMLLAAGHHGCATEVLVIVAGLSIQDPRERPTGDSAAQQAADASHARFADPRSDFLSYLNLWRYLADRRAELSGNQFRRLCRAEYLHFLRIREWQDLHGQLRRVLRELDITASSTLPEPDAVDQTAVHRSLLAGLLSHIGLRTEPPPSAKNNRRRDRNAYLGARNASFAIFPGSGLFRRPPRWLMAAELVETSRLWARTVARIEPEWIEPLATHLVRSTFSEPAWSAKRGAVMARERVTLYGIPIVVDRLTTYTPIDPELCRELFIRHALVQGEWHTNHRFFHRNRELLDEVGEWERRARRHDILVDEQTLFDFYDKRIPKRVASARHFDRWWKGARRETPELLDFTLDSLTHGDGALSEEEYPSVWSTSTPGAEVPARLAVNYRFQPGAPADGVSVDVPLVTLHQVDSDAFGWQVPGHREELVTALVRSLRKDLRRNFVPVPDTVRAALARMRPGVGNLLDELSRALRELAGVTVPREAWRLDKVPEHLLVTFRVIGEDGAVLGTGKDLAELRQRFAKRTRTAVSEAAGADLERSGVRSWADVGPDELPKIVRRERDGYQVIGYPALVDSGAGGGVTVRVLGSEREQRSAMRRGTRRLLLLAVPSPVRQVRRMLSNTASGTSISAERSASGTSIGAERSASGTSISAESLALSGGPHGSIDALLTDCLDAAADAVLARAGGPAWTAAGFDALVAAARAELTAELTSVVAAVVPVLTAATEVRSRLAAADTRSAGAPLGADARSAGAPLGANARSADAPLGVRASGVEDSLADVRDQLAALVHPGFVAEAGADRLPDLARYLRAAARRLETLPRAPERDRDWMAAVHEARAAYDELLAALPPDRALDPDVAEIRWMIEELRVSFFAQGLRTRYPISEKRIFRAIDAQYAR